MVSIMTLTNIEGRTEATLDSSSIASRLMVQPLEPDCLGSDLHTATSEMSHRKDPGDQSSNLCSSSSLTM